MRCVPNWAVGLVMAAVLGAARPARAEPPHRYGVMGDLGVPDGLMASFAYRAHRMVTAYAGLGHNTNSVGLRGGARLLPWAAPVAPYLALEGGAYFSADTPGWMRDLATSAGLDDKTLLRLGYRYVQTQLGLRIGRGAAAFYLQGGVSFIAATVLILKPKPNVIPPIDLYREQDVHVWAVTGHGGLIYWF